MGSIPLLGLLAFYSVFYYGLDVLKSGNDPFLTLIVPGRYVAGKYPKDAGAPEAGGLLGSVQQPSSVVQGAEAFLDPISLFGKPLGLLGPNL
jgi:hypothetical protein